MGFRGALPSARRVVGVALAIAFGVGLEACSAEPRPSASSPPLERPAAEARRVQVTLGDAVIDDRDLERQGAGAVGSEEAAGAIGALPPELLAILHDGPGGPVRDDEDLSLELEAGLRRAGGHWLNGAPSIVDDPGLAPESDL